MFCSYPFTVFRSRGIPLNRSRVAFTLVELLVVIAIIGVLVALLLPAVQAAREAARRSACSNNIRQLAIATHMYHDAHSVLPISISYHLAGPNPSPEVSGKGWIVSILPHLEEQPLYDQFVPCFKGNFESNGGMKGLPCRAAVATQLAVLHCPSDPSVLGTSITQFQWEGIEVSLTSYKGVIGDTRMGGGASIHQGTEPDCHNTVGCNGLFYRNNYQEPIGFRMITDGLSKTLMIGEDVAFHNFHATAFYCNGDYSSCHAPLNYMPFPPTPKDWWNVISFRSLHPGGAHFALADASVRFFNEGMEHQLYRAMSTRAGDETVTIP